MRLTGWSGCAALRDEQMPCVRTFSARHTRARGVGLKTARLRNTLLERRLLSRSMNDLMGRRETVRPLRESGPALSMEWTARLVTASMCQSGDVCSPLTEGASNMKVVERRALAPPLELKLGGVSPQSRELRDMDCPLQRRRLECPASRYCRRRSLSASQCERLPG